MKTSKSVFCTYSVILLSVLLFSCDFKPSPPKDFDFEGISFQYESGWKTKTEVLKPGERYYLDCEKGDNVFIATLVKDTIAPEDFINTYVNKLSHSQSGFSSKPIVSDKLGIYDCECADYSFSVLGTNFYGKVCAFNLEGGSYMVVRQSDTEGRVTRNFKTIENSFKISPPK